MILTDVNPLLNAYNRDFPDHAAARKWWKAWSTIRRLSVSRG
jgi:predicted nucleic acid-binding protein